MADKGLCSGQQKRGRREIQQLNDFLNRRRAIRGRTQQNCFVIRTGKKMGKTFLFILEQENGKAIYGVPLSISVLLDLLNLCFLYRCFL